MISSLFSWLNMGNEDTMYGSTGPASSPPAPLEIASTLPLEANVLRRMPTLFSFKNQEGELMEISQSADFSGSKTPFPTELWYHIASFFDARTLMTVGMLSKAWAGIAQDDIIWKQLCHKKFDTTAYTLSVISWKEFYLTHKIYPGTWDVTNMGKMILSKDFKTATHGGDFLGSYQCVRGNVPILSGVCYWEVQVDKLNPHQTGFHVVIGVVPASFNYRHTYLTSNGGWGYLADGRKAYNSGNGEAYGRKYVQGDHIGVLVDLYRHVIVFYLNGVSQGVAFEGVCGPVFPAVSLLTGGQRASLSHSVSFPSEYLKEC
jgi:hypothetical protein